MHPPVDVVVSGHICLDIIPSFPPGMSDPLKALAPGRLVEIGPVTVATGGAVANTGLALHRLGVSVQLNGKLGDDLWGRAVREYLDGVGEGLSGGMTVDAEETTSYTVVISPPGVDRMFLHHPGANQSFTTEDVPFAKFRHARIFHFGYPPVMRRMYEQGGEELERLFQTAKENGLTTSLDMCMPSPGSGGSKVDWRQILAATLPYVDVFLPSFDEMLLMLHPAVYERYEREKGSQISLAASCGLEVVDELANEFIQYGAAIVGLKLGEEGMYLRTSTAERLAALGRAGVGSEEEWAERTLFIPPFRVEAVNAVGAGDATVAGFLCGLLSGAGPEDVLEFAVAVGAHCVEGVDATSGIVSAERVRQRIAAGWESRPVRVSLDAWSQAANGRVWYGPTDPGWDL